MKEFIISAIKERLEEEMEIIYKEEVKRMNERFQRRKSEIVAGTVLDITKKIQIDQLRDELTITIRKENQNENN